MAIRMEYLLVVVVMVLIVSILGINPSSYEATSSNAQRELAFKNFSLYNIQKEQATQEIFAVTMTKYKNHIEMVDIALKDEKGYELFSGDGIYDEDVIYMESGVKVLSQEGVIFTTSSLRYDVQDKNIETAKPFMLEYNQSTVYGENLRVDMNSKSMSAENIKAKIYFVSEE